MTKEIVNILSNLEILLVFQVVSRKKQAVTDEIAFLSNLSWQKASEALMLLQQEELVISQPSSSRKTEIWSITDDGRAALERVEIEIDNSRTQSEEYIVSVDVYHNDDGFVFMADDVNPGPDRIHSFEIQTRNGITADDVVNIVEQVVEQMTCDLCSTEE